MKIIVTSMVRLPNLKIDEPHIVISVSEPEVGFVEYESPMLLDRLYLLFDDIDRPGKWNNRPGVMMTEEQAHDIWNFVEKWDKKANTIVCQCYAGVSRSAAIAASIAKCYQGKAQYEAYFNTPQYDPNEHVVRTLLEIKGLAHTVDLNDRRRW